MDATVNVIVLDPQEGMPQEIEIANSFEGIQGLFAPGTTLTFTPVPDLPRYTIGIKSADIRREVMDMLTAQIYRDNTPFLGAHWVCRLWEPGGYTWHGQVAHTDFSNATKENFIEKCRNLFGEVGIEGV